MARLKIMLDAPRKSNPTTVAMNIGDIFHAGVSLLLAGQCRDDLLNALGLDVGAIGNGGSYFNPVITRARSWVWRATRPGPCPVSGRPKCRHSCVSARWNGGLRRLMLSFSEPNRRGKLIVSHHFLERSLAKA